MAKLLGIDANKSVVRVALLRTSYRKIAIEALGEASVEAAGGEAAAIRQALGAHKPDAAAIALSGEKSFYRRLDLPATALKEIESVLGFELEATVPFEMEDAVFDHLLLRRLAGSPSLPVFATLARVEDVKQRIQLARDAVGFEPERVGTGPVPLANLVSVIAELEKPPVLGPLALLDLGETTTEVLILQNGEPVFARTLSRGTIGLPDSAPVLARELRQTFAAWRTLGGDPLRGMYLLGVGANAAGAEHFLSVELGISVLPLPRPVIDGVTPENVESLPRYAKAFGLALGLAGGKGKSFNLRKGALEVERSYPFLREKIPLLAGLSAAILVSFGFSVVAELRSLDSEHEMLVAKLQAASKDVLGEELDDPDKAREMLDQAPTSDDDPLPKVDGFDVMVALSKAVPKDLVHDLVELDVQRGHAIIQGTVPKVNDAETIATALKDNKCFKDVKIVRTSQFTEGKQKYVLELDLKCEAPKKAAKKSPEGADAASPASSAKPEKEGK